MVGDLSSILFSFDCQLQEEVSPGALIVVVSMAPEVVAILQLIRQHPSMMEVNEAVFSGYLIVSTVLLFIRYSMVYRHPRVMFLLLWLCMYIFLTARLSLNSFYGQLSKIQYISIQVLTLVAGLAGAIVRTTMEEGRRLNASLIKEHQ